MKRIRESQRDEENKLQIDRIAAMVVKRFSSRQVSQQPLESYLSFLAVPHIATVHCPEVRRDMTWYYIHIYIFIYIIYLFICMMFIDVPLYFLISPRLDIVMVFQVLGILAFFKDGCRCDLVTALVCCKLLSAFFPSCSRVSSLSSLLFFRRRRHHHRPRCIDSMTCSTFLSFWLS